MPMNSFPPGIQGPQDMSTSFEKATRQDLKSLGSLDKVKMQDPKSTGSHDKIQIQDLSGKIKFRVQDPSRSLNKKTM